MVEKYANLGRDKAVAHPCDEEDGTRTWDVFRKGECIAQGFTTRKAAREFAKREPC